MPADRGPNSVIQPIFDPPRPSRSIADPQRAAGARLVALEAPRLDDLLAGTILGQVLGADWFDPMAAGVIDHVSDRAGDLQIGEVGIPAVRRHPPDAVDRVLGEPREALRRAFGPCLLIADLRCAIRA